MFDKQKFLNQLAKEINKIALKSTITNEKFALRLNTLSDVDFVYQLKKYCDLDILNDSTYKNIIVYDYTAIIGKVKKYLGTRYHLTLSRKENNEQNISIHKHQNHIIHLSNISSMYLNYIYYNSIFLMFIFSLSPIIPCVLMRAHRSKKTAFRKEHESHTHIYI